MTQGQQNLMNVNLQILNRLTLRDKPTRSSSSDETEVCNSPGLLVFEYLEQEQPHHRQPLYDKASTYLQILAYFALCRRISCPESIFVILNEACPC